MDHDVPASTDACLACLDSIVRVGIGNVQSTVIVAVFVAVIDDVETFRGLVVALFLLLAQGCSA